MTALRAGAAIISLRLSDRVPDARTVRIRFVHRTRGFVLAASRTRFGRRLPAGADGDVPNTECQDGGDRGEATGQGHLRSKDDGLVTLCQIRTVLRPHAALEKRRRDHGSAPAYRAADFDDAIRARAFPIGPYIVCSNPIGSFRP